MEFVLRCVFLTDIKQLAEEFARFLSFFFLRILSITTCNFLFLLPSPVPAGQQTGVPVLSQNRPKDLLLS